MYSRVNGVKNVDMLKIRLIFWRFYLLIWIYNINLANTYTHTTFWTCLKGWNYRNRNILKHRVDRKLGSFSSRQNWDSTTPSPAGEAVPPVLEGGGGGGTHSLVGGEVGGVLIPTRGQTLWYSRYKSTLWSRRYVSPWALFNPELRRTKLFFVITLWDSSCNQLLSKDRPSE